MNYSKARHTLVSAALIAGVIACGGGTNRDAAQAGDSLHILGDSTKIIDSVVSATMAVTGDSTNIHQRAVAQAPASGTSHEGHAPAVATPQDKHPGHLMPGVPAPVIPPNAAYTAADIHFMQGMIAHHAQATAMSVLAPSHGAAALLQRFAHKIDISQTDEILFMQNWLKDRKQFAPEASSYKTVVMPGMLTKEQFAQLDKARGVEFDKLFLNFMILHHEGAILMVKELFQAGGGQDSDIFRFASDVDADQRAEIDRMYMMLQNIQGGTYK